MEYRSGDLGSYILLSLYNDPFRKAAVIIWERVSGREDPTVATEMSIIRVKTKDGTGGLDYKGLIL
jgi:hypothetical protein